MSTAARIEELRRKFEENPRRYFAPLANELRKAGELSQAIALCREHLPKQPGHMSGYIVFGQALYESESLSEARSVFEQALALDPENLIALRHLGDIARRQGDPLAARRWYERVLDADPRNDDIAAQLATLSTPAYGSRAIPQAGGPAIGQTPVPTPGVPMPVVPAPAPDLRPVSFTPSVPVPIIGAVVPTPDAALRAVDFDEVNARLRTPVPTPLSVPAAFVPTAPVVPPVVPAALAGDLLDLEAMEMEGDRIVAAMPTPMATPVVEPVVEPVETVVESVGTPVDAPIEPSVEPLVEPSTPSIEARFEPVAELLTEPAAVVVAEPMQEPTAESVEPVAEQTDPFAFADVDTGAVAAAEEAALAESMDADASFEEGLAAPEWPDTTELVARVVTPRSVTPAFVDVPVEAADAFGRESSDPVVFSLPEPEPDIADEELVIAADTSTDTSVDVAADVSADSSVDLPWLAPPVTPTEEVEAIADAIAEDARTAGDPDDVSVYALPVASMPHEIVEGLDTEEVSFSDVHPEAVSDMLVEDQDFEAEEQEAPSPAFVTETMGELLVTQGFIERAISVYEELVRRRPYDPVLSSRLAELREQVEIPAPVDLGVDAGMDIGAEAEDVVEEVGHVDVAHDVAHANDVLAAPVYTARERFAALAARRVSRRTPRVSTAVPAPEWSGATWAGDVGDDGLTSLFGAASAEPQDDMAARALADAFASRDVESAAVNDALASSLFDAATAARIPTPAYGTVRTPTPLHNTPLRNTPVRNTPVAEAAAGHAAEPSPGHVSGDVSFDRFFPDPATQAPSGETKSPSSGASNTPDGPSATDDLAQFSVWLKGLGNA
ncbi:tetratricopeptide repeat protein [Gemmatimonas aurantiaca]|uniref:tetratricopeptide repeat protein n=1 Tax=Gemmatimonas aurantiaca TaxID=173480 RepID=UPI00301E236C